MDNIQTNNVSLYINLISVTATEKKILSILFFNTNYTENLYAEDVTLLHCSFLALIFGFNVNRFSFKYSGFAFNFFSIYINISYLGDFMNLKVLFKLKSNI